MTRPRGWIYTTSRDMTRPLSVGQRQLASPVKPTSAADKLDVSWARSGVRDRDRHLPSYR